MSKKNKIEMLEETLDRKLTVAEMYANRPRKWLLYTAIVLIIAVLIGWSANDIHFTGLTATGTEVAKGVVHGVFHPDTDLMFGSGDSDVPYLLLQTIAIAVLGTLFGAIVVQYHAEARGIRCARPHPYDPHHPEHRLGAHVDPRHRPRRRLRRYHPVHLLDRHDLQDVHHRHRGP